MIKLEEELKKIDEEKEKEKEEMKEKQEKAKRKSFANGIKSFCIYVPRSKLICICHKGLSIYYVSTFWGLRTPLVVL